MIKNLAILFLITFKYSKLSIAHGRLNILTTVMKVKRNETIGPRNTRLCRWVSDITKNGGLNEIFLVVQ